MQLGVALVDPSSLSKATFAAPRGGAAGSLTLPAADFGLGAASAELSFTTLQVDTHSATAPEPAGELARAAPAGGR